MKKSLTKTFITVVLNELFSCHPFACFLHQTIYAAELRKSYAPSQNSINWIGWSTCMQYVFCAMNISDWPDTDGSISNMVFKYASWFFWSFINASLRPYMYTNYSASFMNFKLSGYNHISTHVITVTATESAPFPGALWPHFTLQKNDLKSILSFKVWKSWEMKVSSREY